MNTPVLETERLLLRPVRQADAKPIFDCWECDPAVAKYMFWESHHDLEKTKKWVAMEVQRIGSDQWYRWIFVLKSSGQVIGTGLLYFEAEWNAFEIGYNLGQKYWKHGYATEGMKAIIDFAKEVRLVGPIIARCAEANPASANVLEKLGFQYQGTCDYPCNQDALPLIGREYLLKESRAR